MELKKFFLIFLLFYQTSIFSQNYWDVQYRLTSGFIDKNPTFATKLISNYNSNPFEFLAFERLNFVNSCNICVIKMGENNPLDSVTYITNNTNINKNPSIAYNFGNITKAMITWESYVNGKWNIYGRTYNNGTWTAEYPIDTTAGDKHNPCVIFIDSTTSSLLFGIVYEKNSDIIFKRFNALTKAVIYETNLTSGDTAQCRNPEVTKSQDMDSRYYVFYERQKSNGQYAIYYRKAQTASYSWSVPDTFAYIGDNRNAKTISSYSSFESFCFESNRSGKWGLYQTYWDFYYSRFTQSVIIQNNTSEHRNFASQLYPVIAEGTAMLGSYVRQDNDSTRICSGTNIPVIVFNTFAVGDTLKKPLITISNGIPTINSLFRVWMVYNKDSAGYSMLYANGKRVGIFGNINKIGGEIPLTFSLSQNFPNPFNPETNIRFELPRDAYIKLQIFNILGNEIEIIVNKKLSAGSYIVNWNAVTKPNGIYFCKMTVDNTLCFVKKMILIK